MQRSEGADKPPYPDPGRRFFFVSLLAFAGGIALDLAPEHPPTWLLASGIAWALLLFAAWLYAIYGLIRHLLARGR